MAPFPSPPNRNDPHPITPHETLTPNRLALTPYPPPTSWVPGPSETGEGDAAWSRCGLSGVGDAVPARVSVSGGPGGSMLANLANLANLVKVMNVCGAGGSSIFTFTGRP
jgi:hypothetical protein